MVKINGSHLLGEEGLSEVIGFVLLLAIVIVAFSIYLTYGIPAQGRTNEIQHMNDVKDDLTNYKIGIDSLWTNNQISTLMSTTIRMGTYGATTLGSNGFLPIVEPIQSGGTIAINQRTPSPEWLNITSYSYIQNQSVKMNDTPISIISTSTIKSYPNPPDNLFINISGLKNIGPPPPTGTANPLRSIIISGTDQQGTNWIATVNLTQRITFYQNYIGVTNIANAACLALNANGTPIFINNGGGATRTCFVPMNQYNYTGTDLTLTVYKNQTRTLSNIILYDNIATTSGKSYVTDLLDPIYGLSSNIRGTSVISYIDYDPSNEIASNVTALYAYQFQPTYRYSVPLGALEYRTNNNYWIPQTYYYQMGGIFLYQNDGITNKVPPSITFSYNNTGLIGVNIIDIAFDQSNFGSISGTNPIQIGTTINSNSGNLPYAQITNNTMNVTINFTSPTNDFYTISMWKQYFQDTANRTGGIPDNQTFYNVGTTSNGAYIVLKGINDPSNPGSIANNPDINLKVKAVNLTASIQSIGGV